MAEELIARHHIRPADLNSGNFLFGGRMLEWIDDCAATYAMNVLQTTMVVTAKISAVNFLSPARQGDILEFYASVVKAGFASLKVHLRVMTNTYGSRLSSREIVNCDMVFVSIDETGKPTPHGYKTA